MVICANHSVIVDHDSIFFQEKIYIGVKSIFNENQSGKSQLPVAPVAALPGHGCVIDTKGAGLFERPGVKLWTICVFLVLPGFK